MALRFKLLLVISICTLFFTNVVLGATLDVGVYYNGASVGPAEIYIDNNPAGQTGIDGILNNIDVNPGAHIVIAKWNDRSGEIHFTAPLDSHTWLRIDLI